MLPSASASAGAGGGPQGRLDLSLEHIGTHKAVFQRENGRHRRCVGARYDVKMTSWLFPFECPLRSRRTRVHALNGSASRLTHWCAWRSISICVAVSCLASRPSRSRPLWVAWPLGRKPPLHRLLFALLGNPWRVLLFINARQGALRTLRRIECCAVGVRPPLRKKSLYGPGERPARGSVDHLRDVVRVFSEHWAWEFVQSFPLLLGNDPSDDDHADPEFPCR